MSDRYGSYPPDDEPIIGETYPGTIQTPPQGPSAGPAAPVYPEEEYAEEGAYDDEYADEYDDEYGEEDEYYDDEYYEETPARQPLFYVFVGLAALVGGIIIFLLFTLVNNGGGGGASPTQTAAQFRVRVDSPQDNSRIEIGKSESVVVQATSTKPIAQFQLFVNNAVVDTQPAGSPAADNTYQVTLTLPPFTSRGTYQAFVRVTTSTNEHTDSSKINLVAIQPVGSAPQQIQGKVIATVNVRKGPGDNYDSVQTLEAGTTVNIIGKTSDESWLLVDVAGGTWVKAAAIDAQDSLALVPVAEPTPVPSPTPVPAPSPSPSASPSPSPSPTGNLPDLYPQNAQLTNGGSQLQIAIGNQGRGAYSGGLVVGVTGVDIVGGSQKAFDVNIPANGSSTLTFALSTPVTKTVSISINVDPGNVIKETNKDNNTLSIGLQPPVEQPALSLQVQQAGPSALNVTISNSGGPIAVNNASIQVTFGNQVTSLQNVSLAIPKGASQTISGVTRPSGTGTVKVDVLVNGQVLATAQVPVQ